MQRKIVLLVFNPSIDVNNTHNMEELKKFLPLVTNTLLNKYLYGRHKKWE